LLLFAIPGGLSVQAAPPEISNVFPDFPTEYPNASPHLVTGEGFEPGKTEVWVWSPGNEAAAITNALAGLGEAEPILPTQPPPDARRVATLDVERQVLVAPLEGVVVWVRTASGASKPCLFNVPKPCWLGPERAEPGASVHVFGFGLRAPWQAPRLALKGAERHYLLAANPPSRDYRAEDSTLLYFDVPANALPGNYDVFVHNGNGGALGWRKAGLLEIIAPAKIPEKLFNVRDYGAKGDDEGNDYLAIAEAMAAAKSAASNASVRAVVYFPPGKFRTDTTLEVPSGVTLRGASRDLSVVEGFGVLPPDRHTTALVHPAPQTTIESLTFQGFTVKGPGAYWMAMINPPPPKGYNPRAGAVSDFTLRNCRLLAGDSQSSEARFAYLQALAVPRFRNVRILDNDIVGAVNLGDFFLPSNRLEFIGNTIEGGGNADNVSLNVSQLFDSIVDGNQLRHAATRFLVNARRHCAIRFNEVHDYQRAIWANAEETFLVHGDVFKGGGRGTTATATTLTDRAKQWRPGLWGDAEVLIVSGRGFGQHRTVANSTADTLTLRQPWRVTPDASSQYVVGNYFVENSWYANFNDTPGRMSLWLECIGNVVEKHRDAFAGGIDVWGEDSTKPDEPVQTPHNLGYVDHHFMPSWYNTIHDGWFDGSFVKLWSKATDGSPFTGPAHFGNYIVGNHIRQSHMVRTGFELTPHIDGGIWIGNRSSPDMTQPRTNRVALSHTIVADNSISHTPRGISVSDTARKTFLLRNEFEEVKSPVLDWGVSTLQQGNRIITIDERGDHTEPLADRRGGDIRQ